MLLVIDDDPIARYLLRTQLADTTLGVLEASDGYAGLQLARRKRPSCIFLDVEMPAFDGFAVLEALKSDAVTRDIPVVLFTGRALDGAELARAGAACAVYSKAAPTREAGLEALRSALAAAGLPLSEIAPAAPAEDGHA